MINENEIERISKHEVLCTFEDICKACKYVLKDYGELYLIHRPERLADIIYFLRENKLEPKLIRFVEPHIGEKPNMVMIKAVKYGKTFLKFEKALVMYEKDGTMTEEIRKIYGK